MWIIKKLQRNIIHWFFIDGTKTIMPQPIRGVFRLGRLHVFFSLTFKSQVTMTFNTHRMKIKCWFILNLGTCDIYCETIT